MATTPKQMAAKAENAPKPATEAEQPTEGQPTEGQAPEQSTPPAEAPKADEAAKEAAPAASAPASDAKAADPADVADYCAKNGAPQLAAGLIREKATMDQVKTKVAAHVDVATKIRERVKSARATGITLDAKFEETAIETGMTLDAVTDALFQQMTTQQSPEIRGHLSSSDIAGATAGNHGWDAALAKANRLKK